MLSFNFKKMYGGIIVVTFARVNLFVVYIFSYTFRFDKTRRHHDEKADSPCISVKDIYFPDDFRGFNTGSSLAKWSKKCPRWKSTKSGAPAKNSTFRIKDANLSDEESPVDVVSVETENCAKEIRSETPVSDIDPDIRRLLTSSEQGTQEDNDGGDYGRRRGRSKRKGKISGSEKVRKKSKRKARTIKFSLSKPPTPQTVQVIRVDVTSNYSLEEIEAVRSNTASTAEGNFSDCSRGCGTRIIRNRVQANAGDSKSSRADLTGEELDLICRKLVLSNRNLM